MQETRYILALESSGASSSVALYHQGRILGFERFDALQGHAERLVLQAKTCLDQANITFDKITHIAAGRGPGSFTGMRTCLATATGFALSYGAQPVGVNGLNALAREVYATYPELRDNAILSLADSRRQSRYAQLFIQENGVLTPRDSIQDIPDDELSARTRDLSTQIGLPICLAGALPTLSDWPNEAQITHDLDVRAIASEANALIEAHLITGSVLPDLTPLYLAAPKLGPQSRPS